VALLSAFVLTLANCSCSNSSETAQIKADLAEAKKEAAEAKAAAEGVKSELARDKAEVERAKQGLVQAKLDADAAKVKAAKDMAELVKRWNAVAVEQPEVLPNFDKPVTFTWDGAHFPHPTFKGGNAEGYGAFARLLVAFLHKGDNFEFIMSNRMFSANLRSGVNGPSGPDAGWNLAELVKDFSQPNGLGTHDDATRNHLKALLAKIVAASKS
jgi:hypothetical protein